MRTIKLPSPLVPGNNSGEKRNIKDKTPPNTSKIYGNIKNSTY